VVKLTTMFVEFAP